MPAHFAQSSENLKNDVRRYAREHEANVRAQVAGGQNAVAWLFEHDGSIADMPCGGTAWACIEPPAITWGKPDIGWTKDANAALQFSRREDAEAFRRGYLGLYPREWDERAYRVTEHMWPASAAPLAARDAVPLSPKLIGWRTSDYLMETADPKLARNWEPYHDILPIFEGDTITKLAATAAVPYRRRHRCSPPSKWPHCWGCLPARFTSWRRQAPSLASGSATPYASILQT
jgi:hypothetical protein